MAMTSSVKGTKICPDCGKLFEYRSPRSRDVTLVLKSECVNKLEQLIALMDLRLATIKRVRITIIGLMVLDIISSFVRMLANAAGLQSF